MKEQIAGSYVKEQIKRHGWKQREIDRKRNALIVGVRENNIGEGIASRLKTEGLRVWCTNKEQLDVAQRADVSDFPWHDFDTLVLCNGYTKLAWIENQDPSDISQMINDCLLGSILATQAFVNATIELPILKYIVYIGSMAYRNVLNASAPYCAAKAGLAHFTKCMGWELTPKGYRVFCVHPGNTEGTPMTGETIKGIMEYRGIDRVAAEAYWSAINQMPRWLDPSDVGETVWHLVSGRADFMSGTNIELSGGAR